ncbi:WD-40 repeat protein [Spinellus fusiger]|nr:WD-40 repeat protein [Spinellus fusiger]
MSTIENEDTVKLVLQFLQENNLQRTLSALEEESDITLNTVDSKETLTQDIQNGRWDTVLKQVNSLQLPSEVLTDLYEQIVIELLEQKEKGTARAIMSETEPMRWMKFNEHERFMLIDSLFTQPKDMYAQEAKEAKRKRIAKDLIVHVSVLSPSRLLTLLGQCLKWQQQQGLLQSDIAYDLFRGMAHIQKTEEDASVTKPYLSIKFPGKKTYAECAVYSPNGQYLATGTVDGFIEIWNHLTGKLRKDLPYQAEDSLMAMDNAVLCLAFSKDNELLVSGSTDGKIAVWKVQTGVTQRRLSSAHSQGVTSVCFNKDGTQVLSGSYDHNIKLHGLKSGRTLKEFRGHSSFVNSVAFSADYSRVLSASSDGTVKIWDTKTTSCLHTITPHTSMTLAKSALNPIGGMGSQTVQSILLVPKNSDQVLVCVRSNTLYIMTTRGQIIKTYSHHKKTGSDFVCAAMSPQGEFIYGVGEDRMLYCFQAMTSSLLGEIHIGEAEVNGIAGHPFSNILTSYDESGHVYFLKA